MRIDNQILNILDKCTVNGCVVFLPPTQLDRKTYEAANKCLENIGGKWDRKAKGHIFSEDPAADLLDNLILTGETVDLKKQFQYFPTPKKLACKMVELAEIKRGDVLLEPSAGQGAIVDQFPQKNSKILIELSLNNAKVLTDKGYSVMVGDFLQLNDVVADKIIMNPPFTKQQDVDHIIHAYEILKPGGTLVSIVSESPFFRENKKSVAFREFLEQNNAEVVVNDEGAFKESGTMVRTRIVKIVKGASR